MTTLTQMPSGLLVVNNKPPVPMTTISSEHLQALQDLIYLQRVELARLRERVGSEMEVHTGMCVSDPQWGLPDDTDESRGCGSRGCWILKARAATQAAEARLASVAAAT